MTADVLTHCSQTQGTSEAFKGFWKSCWPNPETKPSQRLWRARAQKPRQLEARRQSETEMVSPYGSRRVGFLPAGIWSLLGSGEVAEWTWALIDLLTVIKHC